MVKSNKWLVGFEWETNCQSQRDAGEDLERNKIEGACSQWIPSFFWEMNPWGHMLRMRQRKSSWRLVTEMDLNIWGKEWERKSVRDGLSKRLSQKLGSSSMEGTEETNLIFSSCAEKLRAKKMKIVAEVPRGSEDQRGKSQRTCGKEDYDVEVSAPWTTAQKGGSRNCWETGKGSGKSRGLGKTSSQSLGIGKWHDASCSKEKSYSFWS